MERDRPWIVIVWNDPINLMTYVAYVFQKLFGFPKEKAERLMMQVHEEGKLGALQRIESTAGVERLGADDAAAWLTGLNDLRLVLGTRLGVTEETYADEPRHPGLAVYGWLTWLQGELVEALAAEL